MILAVGNVSAGAWGFLVFVGLIVASVLLFRSMNRRLRRLPGRFPASPPDTPPTPPKRGGAEQP